MGALHPGTVTTFRPSWALIESYRTTVCPEWIHGESNSDLYVANVASSHLTMNPWSSRESNSYFYPAEVALSR